MPIDNDQLQTLARAVVVLENLTKSVDALHHHLYQLQTHQVVLNNKIAVIETTLRATDRDVSDLLKTVRDGNGRPSLIVRLNEVERAQALDKDEIGDMRRELNTVATARIVTYGQVVAGVIGIAVTAVIAVVAALAQNWR